MQPAAKDRILTKGANVGTLTKKGNNVAGEIATQRVIDRFYKSNGDCCAGCDHWEWINSRIGNCKKSNLVSGSDRSSMLRIKSLSIQIESGHVVTSRSHSCDNFIDTFEWGD